MGKLLQFKGKIGHPVHGFGFKRDPGVHGSNGIYTGFHQHPAGRLYGSDLPPMTTNVRYAPSVWNQGQTGSCTGHGKAGMDTTTLAAHGVPLPSPEQPMFEYKIGRAVDRSNPSIPLQDEGAQPNSLVRGSGIWGVVTEIEGEGGLGADSPDYTPYLETHVNDEPKLGELEKASQRLIKGYNAIADGDLTKLAQYQAALSIGHCIGEAVDAGSDLFQAYNEASGPLGFTGYEPDHWIFCVDYATVGALRAAGLLPPTWTSLPDTDLLFLHQNSWGKGLWTKSGRFWSTADFVNRGTFNCLVANLGV